METEVQKTIDESKQGEATMVAGKSGAKKLYLESYGCQMNFADSEIVASILSETGFSTTKNSAEADVIFMNTCSIRENAETRVRNKLSQFNKQKKRNPKLVIGILGCMAERLKSKFLEEETLRCRIERIESHIWKMSHRLPVFYFQDTY